VAAGQSRQTILAGPQDGGSTYRGRLAPSPTGYLHLGHARTFWIAWQRARSAGGTLIFRNEDLDSSRCRPEFVSAMLEDLRWFGLEWDEGPDVGGPCASYTQSERLSDYAAALRQLQAAGTLYPCTCSRQDVLRALQAPHAGDDEPVYPGTCRDKSADLILPGSRVNWRFRVPAGQRISFEDGACGPQDSKRAPTSAILLFGGTTGSPRINWLWLWTTVPWP
jgi:glutamyl-tRNA synthetase